MSRGRSSTAATSSAWRRRLSRILSPRVTWALALGLLGLAAASLLGGGGGPEVALEITGTPVERSTGDLLGSLPLQILAALLLVQQGLALWAAPLDAHRLPRGLALLGLALALGGGLAHYVMATDGVVALDAGEERETWRTSVGGIPVTGYLGFWVGLERWSEARGEGLLKVRRPGGQPVALPLGLDEPATFEGWRLLPIRQRLSQEPRRLRVAWRPREEGQTGETAVLEPSEPSRLSDGSTLIWEGFALDTPPGAGPSARIVHRDASGREDRRRLFLLGGDHEAAARTGPLVLEVEGVERGRELILRVSRRPSGVILHLGLALLALGVLLDRRGAGRREEVPS